MLGPYTKTNIYDMLLCGGSFHCSSLVEMKFQSFPSKQQNVYGDELRDTMEHQGCLQASMAGSKVWQLVQNNKALYRYNDNSKARNVVTTFQTMYVL